VTTALEGHLERKQGERIKADSYNGCPVYSIVGLLRVRNNV